MFLLEYHDQVYLLYYWMRTNLINFQPTKENIADQLEVEFNIDDANTVEEIFQLFQEGERND